MNEEQVKGMAERLGSRFCDTNAANLTLRCFDMPKKAAFFRGASKAYEEAIDLLSVFSEYPKTDIEKWANKQGWRVK